MRMAAILMGVALCAAFAVPSAIAAGPDGSIRVGNWSGGAYTDEKTGAFSYCEAEAAYRSGINVIVRQNVNGSWLLGFAYPNFPLTTGETFPIDVTFDGQAQFHLFGTAISPTRVSSILPSNAVIEFRRSSLMVAVAKGATFQFELRSIGQLLPTIENCVAKTKSGGIAKPVVQSALSAAVIAAILVEESRKAYYATGHPCACPEDRMSNGRRCGNNSAWSRPGGAQPYCYVSDVPLSAIEKYRARLSANAN